MSENRNIPISFFKVGQLNSLLNSLTDVTHFASCAYFLNDRVLFLPLPLGVTLTSYHSRSAAPGEALIKVSLLSTLAV